MNAEDATVAQAVATQAPAIAEAINIITDRIRSGGRLVYIGAGTSGRLGVLDASECPPTFSTPPEMVVGLIAGGDTALRKAVEGAEDHPELAVSDLQRVEFCQRDVLVGIATSGRTPYVIGGLEYARRIGAIPIGLVCNRDSPIEALVSVLIAPIVGPELISGSTRMKAGTATKMILNMLTTGTMIRLGKTYGNLMVDLRATNSKLIARSKRLVAKLTELTEDQAAEALGRCDGELKTTVVSVICQVSAAEARERLSQGGGQLRKAIGRERESSR